MKGVLVRACSGAVYVALIVCLLLFGGAYGFPVLCAVFAVLGAIELQKLEPEKGGYGVIECYDLITVLIISLTPVLSSLTSFETAVLTVIIAVCIRFVLQIYSHKETPADNLGESLLSYIYVGAALSLASTLYMEFGGGAVLTMFLMIWLNDTGAYIVGCSIGRHRLFPRISPKKSWEGFFGGMIFSVAGGMVCYAAMPDYTLPLSLAGIIIAGIVVTIAATWGDLIESMLKRAAHVKDSGKLMPGHGGILDRIDSLLLVAPTLWILLTIFKNI